MPLLATVGGQSGRQSYVLGSTDGAAEVLDADQDKDLIIFDNVPQFGGSDDEGEQEEMWFPSVTGHEKM